MSLKLLVHSASFRHTVLGGVELVSSCPGWGCQWVSAASLTVSPAGLSSCGGWVVSGCQLLVSQQLSGVGLSVGVSCCLDSVSSWSQQLSGLGLGLVSAAVRVGLSVKLTVSK